MKLINDIQLEEKLKEFYFHECERIGNKNCNIENITMFDNGTNIYAYADLSYKWFLNAWEKNVEHKEMIFVYMNEKWQCPLFL